MLAKTYSVLLLMGVGVLSYGSQEFGALDHHNVTGGCPDGWYRLDSKCYSLGGLATPLDWGAAKDWCSENGPPNGNLATIYHPGLQSFLTALLKAFPVDMWVGLSKSGGADFKWADGAPLEYTRWAENQPDGGSNACVKLVNDPSNPGEWDDVSCVEANAFLCQSDLDPMIFNNISIITQCERDDYQSYFDSCFRVETNLSTFAEAQAICESENAVLASLSDRYQEAYAQTVLYSNSLEAMWIGLARNEMPGGYKWQDGWPLTFTSWGMHEPSGEECATITNGETWNATDCNDRRPFICKYTLVTVPPTPPPAVGYCPGDFGRFGDHCYLIDTDMRATSWSKANMTCQEMYGSHLVSVHSDEQRDFLKAHAGLFEATSMWIGMHVDDMGHYEWSDGSLVDYVDFLAGEPSMGQCVEMDVLNDGKWKSDDCNDNSPFFCQLPVLDYNTGGCPLDWYKIDNKCYSLAGEVLTWSDAKQYCQDNSAGDGNLASIYVAGLQSFLTAILNAFPVDVWIGLYTNSTDPTFQWSDGSPVVYQNWAEGQPDGGLDKCGRMVNDPSNPGMWDDSDCSDVNFFLCQSNPDPNLPGNPDVISNCFNVDYQSYFDSCFRVETNPMTYAQAIEMCESEGAQLASVTDLYQEAFVQTVLYNNRLNAMWLGLSTDEVTHRYQWEDDWPLTFTSWAPEQPNGEGCVYMDSKGYWNGDDCNSTKPFICKYTSASPPSSPPPTSGFCPTGWTQQGENCYLFDNQLTAMSWTDAHDDCQSKYGSDLASIHDMAEEEFIRQGVSDFTAAEFWIGMERNSYSFKWTDASLVDYVNWLMGEPTTAGDCTMMNANGWAMADCMTTKHYVCKAPVFSYDDAGCPQDWYKLDKKCYTLAGQNNKATWQDAQQQCVDSALGNGNLATIYVDGLQSFLTAILNGFPEDDVWIGLYTEDSDSPNDYKWVDGSPVGYTYWAYGEPDGNMTTKCVEMVNDAAEPGRWNDADCMENKLFLCQSDPDPNLPGNPDIISNCVREGYQSYFDSCFRVESTPMTHAMAMEACHNESAQLASLADLYQEAFVKTVLYNNRLQTMWIGLTVNELTGEYQWEDGWPLTFTSWSMNEPSGEGYVVMTSDGSWDATNSQDMHPFICKSSFVSPPPEPTPAPGYCPSGWDQLDGSCYLFDSSSMAMSWSQAEADCQKKYGASLVSLHTSNEEDFVMQMADTRFSTSTVWVGMDREINLQWMDKLRWTDESLVNYVNWFGGEPNDSGDCVEISITGAGGWRTVPCSTSNHYVCKLPVFDYAESGCPPDWYKLDKMCYTLAGQNDPLTWQQARQYCRDNGVGDGDLATVYIGGLQSFLSAIIKAFPVDLWIGLYNTNVNPEFQWADGAPVTYTNWDQGQPDGAVGTGYCVKMINDPSDPGNWDDVECTENHAFLCQSSPDPNLPGNPDVISNCQREGYQSYFDSCFRVETNPMTFDMAKATCEAESSQLASLSDAYQEAFVQTVLYNNRLDSMWLGMKLDEVTGDYQFIDGWPLTFTSWGMHEPSGEGCVVLNSEEKWDAVSCTESKSFICKYSQVSPPAQPTPESGYCPDDWEYHDGFCYHFDPDARAVSWDDAQMRCQDNFGAHLVSVHTNSEQEYVMGKASELYEASSLWLGMQASSMDGTLMWVDNSLVSFVNWMNGEPTDMGRCVEMSLSGQGEWKTDDCMDNNPYVCKAPVFGEGGGCPNGWYKLKDKCYTLGGQVTKLNYDDAQAMCETEANGILASIQVSGIQSFLTAVLKGIDGDVWIGLRNGPGVWGWEDGSPLTYENWAPGEPNSVSIDGDVWIGLRNGPGVWGWEDGSPLTYENWAPGEPNSGSNQCAKMLNDPSAPGQWVDLFCTQENAYLCQTDINPTLPGNPDIISQCERPGYQSYFQSCFRVVTEAKTFAQAQATCQSEAANLASLNDLYEEGFAEVVLFNNDLESAWIGLQADATTGQYEWLDGWPLTFTKWRLNEPSKVEGKGCVALSNNPESSWIDESCDEMKGFVCKYTFSSPPEGPPADEGYCPSGWEKYNGHCYLFQASQTLASWDLAQYECQREGAHLPYLHSNEEVDWVTQWSRNTWGEGSTWIGLRRDFATDLFEWTNQDLVDYVNWDTEPSNTESCIHMRTDVSGLGAWLEEPCEATHNYVCKMMQLGPVGGCPFGWYKLRDKCYKLGGGPEDPMNLQSWYDAKQTCTTEGPNGRLAYISNNGLQAFLTAILKGVEGDVWTGLSTVGQGGNPREFIWDGNYPLNYTNWAEGQPDGPGDSDNCVKLMNDPEYPGSWDDTQCEMPQPFICESDLDSTLPANPPIISRCLRSDYQSYITNCFKINLNPATFSEAQAACEADEAQLASFSDKFEQAFAQTVLYSNDVGSMWMGMSQDESSGHYMWTDSWPLTFTGWAVNEPSGESCVKFTNEPGWEAEQCDVRLPYMCKFTFESAPTIPPAVEGNCPAGWQKWGTSCYWIQESSLAASWEDSHAACQAVEGANLLSVHSAAENSYIQELATVTWGRASVWLGMSRNNMHVFEWSDSSMVDFVHWSSGEPNGLNVEENCIEFNSETGTWNDEDCSDYSRYICKLPQREEVYPPEPTDRAPTDPGEPTDPDAQTGLQTGEIIGIAVACATVLLVAVIAAYYLCIREDKKKFDTEAHPNKAYSASDDEDDEL